MENVIIIQGAMDVETETLINALNEKQEIVLNGYKFYKGKIGTNIVVISITKVGAVNAAVATILGINTFKPRCIINQGVAGGHNPIVHKGNIVLGEFVANMNSYKTPFAELGKGIHPENWKMITFNEGKDIEKEKVPGDEKILKEVKAFLENADFKVHCGTIVSGDGWNKECDRINWFVNEFNSLAEDMETYSVYKVCNANNIPILGMRIISNSEINKEEYERGLGIILQNKIIEMIENNNI